MFLTSSCFCFCRLSVCVGGGSIYQCLYVECVRACVRACVCVCVCSLGAVIYRLHAVYKHQETQSYWHNELSVSCQGLLTVNWSLLMCSLRLCYLVHRLTQTSTGQIEVLGHKFKWRPLVRAFVHACMLGVCVCVCDNVVWAYVVIVALK